MRLCEEDFATAVHRTLRAAHRAALTHSRSRSRSRSFTHLAAPAFGGAMMGWQILGATTRRHPRSFLGLATCLITHRHVQRLCQDP